MPQPLDIEQAINRKLSTLTTALRTIANNDCDFFEEHQPGPCTCPPCVAKAALAVENDWRYIGHRPERMLGTSPTAIRERAMNAAWKKYMTSIGGGTPDSRLASILGLDEVNPRDWYVATTIIQWLATNVGQCTLSDAHYHYRQPVSAEQIVTQMPGPFEVDNHGFGMKDKP